MFSRKLRFSNVATASNETPASAASKSGRIRPGLQRHQARQRLRDPQAEAARHVVAEARRAHLRDRQPARRQHQRRRGERSRLRHDAEVLGPRHLGDGLAEPQVDAARRAFGQQHGDDGARRAVAEQLPQRLLVEGDPVAADEIDEVGLRVAAQRRRAEVRVAGQEAVGRRGEVGEIAAPAAGDEDLGAGLVGVLEQQDLAAALAGGQRAHQPGGAGAEDDGVERRVGCRHEGRPTTGTTPAR